MPAAAPRSEAFLDTNVLLYLPGGSNPKAARATALLSDGGVVSSHVLGEVVNTMRGRRWKKPWPEVHALLATIRASTLVLPVTVDTHARAVAYAERYKLQYFDALHIASAVMGNCTVLLTEDMHDGLVIDGLTVRNPFA
jgi:predicted nucleic acid-binding protein